jgi:hypothetical protein
MGEPRLHRFDRHHAALGILQGDDADAVRGGIMGFQPGHIAGHKKAADLTPAQLRFVHAFEAARPDRIHRECRPSLLA